MRVIWLTTILTLGCSRDAVEHDSQDIGSPEGPDTDPDLLVDASGTEVFEDSWDSGSDIDPLCPSSSGDDCSAACSDRSAVGCPCVEHTHECYCLPTREGYHCNEPCTDECASGTTCLDMTLHSEIELTYVCASTDTFLCMPCESDLDCNYDSALDSIGRCVSYGGGGSFCGMDCSLDACPTGYSCQDGQCILEEGECACAPFHKELHASTPCTLVPDQSIGVRWCADDGLTACKSAMP